MNPETWTDFYEGRNFIRAVRVMPPGPSTGFTRELDNHKTISQAASFLTEAFLFADACP